MPVKTDQCIHEVSLSEQCKNCVNNITKFFEKKLKKSSLRESKENKNSDELEKVEAAKEMCEEVKAAEECEKPAATISPTERKKKKSPPESYPSRNNTEKLEEPNQIQENPITEPEVTNTNISQDNKVIDPKKNKKDKNEKKEKKKTKEFKDHDLEELRSQFARKQGVKEIKAPVKEDVAPVDEGAGGEMKVVKSDVEESLYEPVGEEREEFVMKRLTQTQTNQRDGGEISGSDDNIIGFDLNTKDPEITGTENKAMEGKTDHVESSDPPKLPSRRKNSKHSATNSQLSVEEKLIQREKKSSFIKEWQKDLKDFFTLRKKKTSSASVDVPRWEAETPHETEHLNTCAEEGNNK